MADRFLAWQVWGEDFSPIVVDEALLVAEGGFLNAAAFVAHLRATVPVLERAAIRVRSDLPRLGVFWTTHVPAEQAVAA